MWVLNPCACNIEHMPRTLAMNTAERSSFIEELRALKTGLYGFFSELCKAEKVVQKDERKPAPNRAR
jgi:hypothetical protein